MMLRIMLILLVATLLMLCLSSCDPDTVPFETFCSIQGDGTQFVKSDYGLDIYNRGRAFYLSDNQVFYLGGTLLKGDLTTGQKIQLIPNDPVYKPLQVPLLSLSFSLRR